MKCEERIVINENGTYTIDRIGKASTEAVLNNPVFGLTAGASMALLLSILVGRVIR